VRIDKAQRDYVKYVRSLRKVYTVNIIEERLKEYTTAQDPAS